MKENLTIEQQIIDYLTYMKVMTRPYVLDRALKDQEYAKEIITGNGLIDEIVDAGMGGSACDHQSLTNDEIQEVFDNDEEITTGQK